MARKKTQEEFINLVKNLHGDRYDYSKVVYVNDQTKVCIICHEKDEFGEEHGEFWVTPNNFLRNRNCPKCKKRVKLDKELFLKRAISIHENKYDYSKTEIHGVDTKVIITCPIHGDFEQTPYKHLNRKQGCPKCGIIQKGLSKRLSLDTFLERAKNVHGNKYDYSKVEYVGIDTKVCIICPEHGEFYQTPYVHTAMKCGCPVCNRSKLEEEIMDLLDSNNITYEYRKRDFDWLCHLELDLYIPEYKIAIECLGKLHFEPVDFGDKNIDIQVAFESTVFRDTKKRKLCEENGILILYYSNLGIKYPYEVYENKEELLNKIKEYGKKKSRNFI